ncbi:hypothetical protein LJR164_000778 [Phenylobacterium sp. LjRoot164]|uniref:calcium-binding protein n=1 Tax=unclassified Phenylobacterium TaxID=2640670 RepID=UPI003ECCFADA
MFLIGKAVRDVLKGGAGDDTLYGYGGDDSLSGGGGSDVLAGHEGNDSLNGGTGDDYLLGGAGTDILDGGAGVDWAAYEDATAGVTVSLALTGWQETGGGGRDKLSGIENLYGSAFNDTLIGDAGVNYLSGGAGDDRLEGGAGDDHLEGGLGNDTIIGGDGWDVVSYDDGIENGVYVNLTTGISYGHAAGPENSLSDFDVLSSIEDVYGTNYSDYLEGNAGGNYLAGRDGDDGLVGVGTKGAPSTTVLDGGNGDDTMRLGYGETFALGGEGADQIVVQLDQFSTPLTIDLAKTHVQNLDADHQVTLSSVEGLTLNGMGSVTVFASTAQNKMTATSANATFVYRSLEELGLGSQADVILTGYQSKIDLRAIDADTNTAGDQAFRWVLEFTGSAGEAKFSREPTTGYTRYEFDVNGDGIADAGLTADISPSDSFLL